MRNRFVIASWTLGLCAFVRLASAEPSPSDRDKARELMASGRSLRAASDLQGALKSFAAANEIMHVPTTLFEVASTQSALGQLLAARETLTELARAPSEPGESEAFGKARHNGDELLSSIEQRIPSLDVSIEDNSGAHPGNLLVDGHDAGEAREFNHLRLDPGKHQLVATSGASKREASITLVEGEARHIDLLLEAPHGSSEAATPRRAPAASNGEPSPWLLYTLGGLGVAGLGAGIGFEAEAKHVKSALQNSCAPVCTSAQADRVRHWNSAANVSFAVGGAAVVAAVVVLIVQSSHSEAPPAASHALSLGVLPTSQGATLEAAGRF